MQSKDSMNSKVEEILRRIDLDNASYDIFIDDVGDDKVVFSFSYDNGMKYIGIKRVLKANFVENNINVIREKLDGYAFQIKKEESGDLEISYYTRIEAGFSLSNVLKIMLNSFYPYS